MRANRTSLISALLLSRLLLRPAGPARLGRAADGRRASTRWRQEWRRGQEPAAGRARALAKEAHEKICPYSHATQEIQEKLESREVVHVPNERRELRVVGEAAELVQALFP